jgi:hypothetical protein
MPMLPCARPVENLSIRVLTTIHGEVELITGCPTVKENFF